MNSSIRSLIVAIVSQVVEKGGYVTKTKLLKLLYLLDVEYYRVHRETFTGLNWKFFHLGPWAREFDPLLEELLQSEALVANSRATQDYDATYLRAAEPRDLTGLFSTFADEAVLRRILNTWAEARTGEILDYVYFRTEPMEHGIRNEPLDFSSISQEKIEKYVRPQSTTSDKEIRKQRKDFQKKLTAQKAQAPTFQFTPPRYDEEFEKALTKIETDL